MSWSSTVLLYMGPNENLVHIRVTHMVQYLVLLATAAEKWMEHGGSKAHPFVSNDLAHVTVTFAPETLHHGSE